MPQSQRFPFPLIALVFGLAFLVRLVLAIQWQDTPYGSAPLLDAEAYHRWAQEIAAGHWLRARAFYQSPLYPYLLGLLYALFGPTLWGASLLNAVLGAGAAAGIAAFTGKLYGRAAGLLAGLLAALHRPSLFYAAPPMKEPLTLFLLALFLPIGFRAWQENKGRDYALAGLLIGLGALTRGNLLLLAPVLAVMAFVRWRRAALRPVLLLCGTAMLTLAPATIHNALASRDFVLVNYADGFNFYIGHSPVANGTNAYPPEVSTDPIQEELNTAWIARQATNQDLKPSGVSAYWRGRAWEEILSDPWRELPLLRNKLEAFWNGTERFDNYDIPFIAKEFDTLLALPLVGFGLISTLAAFSLIPAQRRGDQGARYLLLLLGAYLLSVLPFYVTDRYRLPAIVFLLPLAGASLPYACRLWRERAVRGGLAALLLAALFCFLAARPDPTSENLTAFHWGTLTSILNQQGRDAQALQAFDKGHEVSAIEVGPQAYTLAADSAQRLGDRPRAEALKAEALALFPNNGILRYNMGRDEAALGQLDKAKASFEAALRLNPSYALSAYALALLHEKTGDLEQARAYARRGLVIDPADTRLNEVLKRLSPP